MSRSAAAVVRKMKGYITVMKEFAQSVLAEVNRKRAEELLRRAAECEEIVKKYERELGVSPMYI